MKKLTTSFPVIVAYKGKHLSKAIYDALLYFQIAIDKMPPDNITYGGWRLSR